MQQNNNNKNIHIFITYSHIPSSPHTNHIAPLSFPPLARYVKYCLKFLSVAFSFPVDFKFIFINVLPVCGNARAAGRERKRGVRSGEWGGGGQVDCIKVCFACCPLFDLFASTYHMWYEQYLNGVFMRRLLKFVRRIFGTCNCRQQQLKQYT